MNMYDALFSPGFILNEQIARQVFDILPDNGPIMIIMDKEGNNWPSNSEQFAKSEIDESFLGDICQSIDDGSEPVITNIKDSSVIAAQLVTERTKCGYVIFILPQCSPESALINVDFIEMLISQMNLIAKLIEKNCQLYELKMRHTPGTSAYVSSEIASN